jgi:hypothetical protein
MVCDEPLQGRHRFSHKLFRTVVFLSLASVSAAAGQAIYQKMLEPPFDYVLVALPQITPEQLQHT